MTEVERAVKAIQLTKNISILLKGEKSADVLFALSFCLYALLKDVDSDLLNKDKIWEIIETAKYNYNQVWKLNETE